MTEEGFKRKLTAILSADVEGYSRLMGEDEDATIRTLTAYRELMSTLIEKHRGRVVDSPGDNLLAEFTSVVDAVRCAVEIQEELRIRNAELPENRRMEFRIGINLGDVVQEGERIYGDGVNITARVEGLAHGGGICISGTVYDSIKNKLSLSYESLGEHTVKNITEPVRVYRMRVGPEVREEKAGPRRWQRAALAAVVILVVAAGAWAIWNFYFRPPPIEPASVEKMAYPLPENPSVAVLPFVNMTGDPEQEFFSDGLTDQIIASLSKAPGLFVIARNSSFTYKGKPVKVQQVAEDLGVRYVLEGSVRKSEDKLRVTVQLIDALKGHHLWAEQYDREMKDVFAVQDDITMQILKALQVQLTAGPQGAKIKGTQNLQAYLKFLEAMSVFYKFTRDGNVRARQLAEEAIAIDPEYARAYALLSFIHQVDIAMGLGKSRRQSQEKATQYAKKAQSLDEKDSMGYTALVGHYVGKRDYENAIKEAQKAINLAPGAASPYTKLGQVLCFSGRSHEAIDYFKKAIRIDPFPSPHYYLEFGYAYFLTGDYEEAVRVSKKACALAPDNEGCHRTLASAYGMLGKDTEARAEAAELLRIMPEWSIEGWKQRQADAWKHQADVDHFAEGLRRAGLPEKPPLPLPDKPSIAVLPFVNMSEDPKQEFFSDGITEEIITAISKVPDLFVIARNSTFTYKGKPVKVQQVGRELGVRYVLEGSVRKAGNKVRITAQLVDAQKGHHLWAERYDRDLKDIFAIQDEITMKIIVALQVKLTMGEQARLQAKGTDNLEAYLKLLQANEYLKRLNKEGNALARQILEEVIALDPAYPSAYRALGVSHMMDVWLKSSKSPRQSMAMAIKLTKKAIALDDFEADGHGLLGLLYTMTRQYEKGIAEAERAVALNTNSARAHARLGMVLRFAGRPEEAIALYKKAIRLNPFPPSNWLYGLGLAYLFTGQCQEAIIECEKAVHGRPDDLLSRIALTVAYGLCGREEEARATATEILRIDPKFSVAYFAKKLTYKNQADKERFIDALRKAGLK